MQKRLVGIIFGMVAALIFVAGCGLVYKEEFLSNNESGASVASVDESADIEDIEGADGEETSAG